MVPHCYVEMTETRLSDLEMEKALSASQSPTQLLKYSGKGKPLFRDFTLSKDFTTLQWESDNRRGDPKTLEISKIVGSCIIVSNRYSSSRERIVVFVSNKTRNRGDEKCR